MSLLQRKRPCCKHCMWNMVPSNWTLLQQLKDDSEQLLTHQDAASLIHFMPAITCSLLTTFVMLLSAELHQQIRQQSLKQVTPMRVCICTHNGCSTWQSPENLHHLALVNKPTSEPTSCDEHSTGRSPQWWELRSSNWLERSTG